MKRLIVLGGLGMFGRTAVGALRSMGLHPLVASRRPAADIQVDANNPNSVRAAFAKGDLVLDTAGPFQDRSPVLIEAAIDLGLDLIDISDDLSYAQKLLSLAAPIDRAGIRVLNACSSVSAISSCLVTLSRCKRPIRVSGFLAPATRHTGNPASALSLIRSVGRPVRAFRGGKLVVLHGWSEARRVALSDPRHTIRGRLFESADAVHLPRRWPTLSHVDMYVDTNTPGLNTLLRIAARVPALRNLLERQIDLGTRLSRFIGSAFGALAYEIQGDSGETVRFAVLSRERSYLTPIAPAVLAAKKIADGQFEGRGIIPPDRHVDPTELCAYLKSHGIKVERVA